MARDMLADVNYFGTMMVRAGDADGMVSGAVHTTASTIRPALQARTLLMCMRYVSPMTHLTYRGVHSVESLGGAGNLGYGRYGNAFPGTWWQRWRRLQGEIHRDDLPTFSSLRKPNEYSASISVPVAISLGLDPRPWTLDTVSKI